MGEGDQTHIKMKLKGITRRSTVQQIYLLQKLIEGIVNRSKTCIWFSLLQKNHMI